jgi:cell wall-associated NlpC family hydrolase
MKTSSLCWVAAATTLVAALVAAPLSAAPPKQLREKEAQAQAVLAQVSALDQRFERTDEDWNVARLQLRAADASLAKNRQALHRAQAAERLAQARVAERLVTLYESDNPSTIDVLAGSSSLGEIIDRVEATQAVTDADHRLAVQAASVRIRLAKAREALLTADQEKQSALHELTRQRAQIGSMLSRRRTLLASVQTEVAAIKAREQRRQEVLAAQARARVVAAQQAALARQAKLEQQRASAARAAAARAAAAKATATTTTSTPPVTTSTTAAPEPPPTTTTPTTTAVTPTTTAQAPLALPPSRPGAAAAALNYLGDPYKWGGASPAGFDCSGLVMVAYAQIGISLPHSSQAQYGLGVPVPRDQLEAGDLVFFDGLDHVGIYIGGGQIVHAPHTGDVVRIASLASFGSRYVGARRI